MMRKYLILSLFICFFSFGKAQVSPSREHLSMDSGWKFALGHATDPAKDFNFGTGYFSFFAKTGYGDGAAAKDFDDRAWRVLNVPHDWAVELPFDGNASHSHGYHTIGYKYPENSIGWYRRHFDIPQSDLGRRISVQFDGVHRNAMVFVNGFYVGQKHSGYTGVEYDLTDYLNYGGDNVIAVRADASIEEGWYYEGAGIYRHVWLNKTEPLHVAQYGTFVTTDMKEENAAVTVRTTIRNDAKFPASFTIEQTVLDAKGNKIATDILNTASLKGLESGEFRNSLSIDRPNLWSLENPYMHKLVTRILSDGKETDRYETPFGIRTVQFDADKGFFLNGKPVKILGTNNHQDHAGVGTAIPDALQEFRILRLKEMGSNAIRTSHNPPTPEFLDACDKLGMLVLDENRLMGSSPEHLDELKSMMLRDRNHPSVILWSLGNEEWAIEGNITGARIATTMQDFAQKLDSSRRFTTAISGGWGWGISTVIDVMGFNYLWHGNIDEHHKKFPDQPGVGTEETTTSATRGVYLDPEANSKKGHLVATDRTPSGPTIERGWKYYDERPFLAGLFFWTGFDYRGEPTPYGWPAVSSQFGIVDVCGFPKDQFYYLKSWWTKEPVLYVAPHWNWQGREGQTISIWAYGNCDEVELFLNKKSLGRNAMPKGGHLEWPVSYKPGILMARGYKNGKEIISNTIETTGNPVSIKLIADKTSVKADGSDVSVITVQVTDSKGRIVPDAMNEISFKLDGPGRIIGVGNGDPSSHEPDQFVEEIKTINFGDLKVKRLNTIGTEVAYDYDDSGWTFFDKAPERENTADSLIVIRGTFELNDFTDEVRVTLFGKSVGEYQSVYINGSRISDHVRRNSPDQQYILDHMILNKGKNVFAVTGTPLKRSNQWENLNADPGIIQVVNPAGAWKRKLFNGLAQIIVQSSGKSGEIMLTAAGDGLENGVIKISAQPVELKPAVK